MGEVRHHPWTSLAAMVALAIAGYNFTGKASAGDIDTLKQSIVKVASSVEQNSVNDERRSLAQRIDDIDRELFNITIRINDLQRDRVTVDNIILQRQDQLTKQRQELSGKLQALGGRP